MSISLSVALVIKGLIIYESKCHQNNSTVVRYVMAMRKLKWRTLWNTVSGPPRSGMHNDGQDQNIHFFLLCRQQLFQGKI